MVKISSNLLLPYLTFVVFFNPDPRISRQPDPERSSRGDISEVVDKCLGSSVGERQVGAKRHQISANGVAVTVCLEPGCDTGRPGGLGRNHIS